MQDLTAAFLKIGPTPRLLAIGYRLLPIGYALRARHLLPRHASVDLVEANPMKERVWPNFRLLSVLLALLSGYPAFGAGHQVERSPGGECKIYDDRHVLRASGHANGSVPNGIWNYYESTGLKLVQIRYRRGIKEGLFQTWYGSMANRGAAGKLQLTGQFRDNQMDGLIKAYDSEGKPLINRQYVAGKIEHAQTFFGQAPGIDTPTAAAFAQRLDQSDQAFFQQIEPVVFDALKSDNR
jgi:hypothetical protein